MTTQQQTERDEALIEQIIRSNLSASTINAIIERLHSDEPAKPDRYVVAARESWDVTWRCDYQAEREFAIAAVLRKHFEPSAEVVEAARMVKAHYSGGAYPWINHSITLADFILKGDQ